MKTQTIIIFALILLTTSLVSAYPGIPHQFYGDVTVNSQPAPDNNVLVASIDGDEYITITKDGQYGFSPNIFYIEDPEGNRQGDITFYLGGKNVGSFTFQNNGFTKFDISTTTNCGDSYCLGDETCSSCQEDCGICTDPPVITIVSPEGGVVYDSLKVDLIVSSDQEIVIWMYALNSQDPLIFTPNITLTLNEGSHELTVIGMGKENYLSGSKTVLFSISLPVPYCGDAICNNGETCSSCPVDCGTCPPPDNGGGGSSGGGGGGGGSSSSSSTTTLETTTTTETQEEGEGDETIDLISDETQQTTGPGITGAVIGFAKSGVGIASIFVVFILIAGIVVLTLKKKSKSPQSSESKTE